ncbi:MAG: choice-of-anchor J domain-containing protein [Erysipelotrichaceae bacterium]|nr:choice-of-anchor J domain-containing protein [Erysipelotrichaceae bacterium]
MKGRKLTQLLLAALMILMLMPATVQAKGDITKEAFSWSNDFEESLEGWSYVDYDGDGFCWQWVGDSGSGTLKVHSGIACLMSASYDNDTYTALTPDNWMLTPALTVPEKDAKISFWICGQDPNYASEVMALMIAPSSAVEDTTVNLALFEQVGKDMTATGTYVEYTYDISDYAGEEVVFAFRHYNVTDMFYLNLDDVSVTGENGDVELLLDIDAAKMSTDGIVLEWTDVKADSYNVYRDDELVATVTDTEYLDEVGRHMGDYYEYSVEAVEDDAIFVESKGVEALYNPFPVDVYEGTATFTHVAWAWNNNIINGLSNNHSKFGTENLCRRSQFCYMLWRMAGSPSVSGSVPFTDLGDLSGNNKKALIWCYQEGIVNGTSATTFAPSGDINRAQLAIMVWKMAGQPKIGSMTCPYTDIDGLTSNNKKAVIWCYNNGLIDSIGDVAKFQPKAKGNRALLAEMMYGLNLYMGLVPVDAAVANDKLAITVTAHPFTAVKAVDTVRK